MLSIALLSWTMVEPVERVEPTPTLQWEAPSECPDVTAVRARVEQLIGRPLDPSDEQVSAHAAIEIADGARLRLRVQSETGSREHTIEAPSCAEVTEAAAVIIAIAIDPAASLRPLEPPPPKAVPPSSPPPEPEPEPVAPPEKRSEGVAAVIRVAAAAAIGALPRVTAAFEAGAGVQWPHARLDVWAEHWLARTSVAPASAPSVGITARLTLGRAHGCWVPTVGARVAFPLCAGAGIGAVHARGRGVPRSSSRRVLFGSAHLQGAVSFNVAGPLALAPFVRVEVPFLRPAFSLDGYGVVHRTAAAGLAVGLSVELHFRSR